MNIDIENDLTPDVCSLLGHTRIDTTGSNSEQEVQYPQINFNHLTRILNLWPN